MGNKDKRKGRIQKRYSILLITLGLVIMLTTAFIGFYKYLKVVRNLYFQEATDITQYLRKDIDLNNLNASFNELKDEYRKGNFQEARERISQTPEYNIIDQRITNLSDYFDCSVIMVYQIEDSLKDYYVSYRKELGREVSQEALDMLEKEDTHVALIYAGDYEAGTFGENRRKFKPGALVLVSGEEYHNNLQEFYESKDLEHVMIQNNDQGADSTVPVMESLEAVRLDDTIIGFISVQIPEQIFIKNIIDYLLQVGILSIVIISLFLLIYHFINRKYMFKPLETITQETSTFLENNNHLSEKLAEIKTKDEIEILANSILKLEIDLKNYIENLKTMTAERERIQAELDLATNIQMSLLPQEFPAFPERSEFDIYALMKPAKEVGGDFYDYFLIDEDHLGSLIGDVSGKGIPAALFMANAKTLINAIAHTEKEAAQIYNNVNDYLVENNGALLFITSWFGIYEISTGILRFINAGHEAPVVFHNNGSYEEIITKPNIALGLFDGVSYQVHEMELKPGDKIFLMTDGVTEAQNNQEELFGKDRLIESIQKVSNKTLQEILEQIYKDVDSFTDEAEQFDDITLVGLYIS